MAAFWFLAGQKELPRSGRLRFTFTSIKREEDWCTASLTGHAEIGPRIGLGPSRNVHWAITTDVRYSLDATATKALRTNASSAFRTVRIYVGLA